MVIDLAGPDGNAFALMAYVQRWARQLGWSRKFTEEILADMRSSDYEHLLDVIEEHFGHIVTLKGRD